MDNGRGILIIGDVMLDRYISGSVDRISPEAPVPVVKVTDEWTTLGGAANVAANVAALGAKPTLIGLVGNDGNAKELADVCKGKGIVTDLIEGEKPTITKTRVISGQQIVRVDREQPLSWEEDRTRRLLSILEQRMPACELVLLSDYAKGTLSEPILRMIFEHAATHGKRVLVDPKCADWSVYRGAYLITPNLKELALANGGIHVENDDNRVVSVARKLLDGAGIGHILCTRSSYGMTLISEDRLLNIPTRAQEVFDVSGAGDTALATLGVMLAGQRSLSESAFAANAAAGIVVGKLGTAVADRVELDAFLRRESKLMQRTDSAVFNQTNSERKVVFTNGCFDVLHQGHRQLLRKAKELGDVLVVGLNSDSSISRLKGSSRPINVERDRIEAISALPFVDHVMVFDEDTPRELLSVLKADILVKGGDYSPSEVVGNDLVGEVVIIDLVEGLSTTNFFTEQFPD